MPKNSIRDNFWFLRYDFTKWTYSKLWTDKRLLKLTDFERIADFAMQPNVRSLSLTNSSYLKRESKKILRLLPKLESAKIVYVHQVIADRYANILRQAMSDFSGVVILDPTDGEYASRPQWLGRKCKWVAPHIPNPLQSDGLCIPVGIPEWVNRRDGNSRYLRYLPWDKKKNQVLVGPFGATHHSREILKEISYHQIFHFELDRLAPRNYYKLLAEFRYVLCPRGNGIDTHRLWETLYSGSIPIVEQTEWSSYFISHGLPIIEVKSLLDAEIVRDAISNSSWQDGFETDRIPALTIKYWKSQIDKFQN